MSLRLNHALSRTQSLHLGYRDRRDDDRNLGVGDFDLPERAYARTRTRIRF